MREKWERERENERRTGEHGGARQGEMLDRLLLDREDD